MKIPELLAPVGTMEKLIIAVHYGADAVYLGGKSFGLRSPAGNFDDKELSEAVEYAHKRNVRVFLTVNAYLNSEELPDLRAYLERIASIAVDAYIASDPGVISIIREISPEKEIHLSTQANTTNWQSALFWQQQGIKRINLARETTLKGIKTARDNLSAELEIFVHGALCIAYSGRCLLSGLLSGRYANKGECAHPCRWGYALVEETRPGRYFPIEESDAGTFIFNSKDLCLLPYIPQLVQSGVDSLKVEGRMKGSYYVASVVRVYRAALDRYASNPEGYVCDPAWMEELQKISHRGYTSGFLFGNPGESEMEYNSRYLRSHKFVAMIEGVNPDGTATVGIRNRMALGEELELIGPGMKTIPYTLNEMIDTKGKPLTVCNPNMQVIIRFPFPVEKYDMLRRESEAEEEATE